MLEGSAAGFRRTIGVATTLVGLLGAGPGLADSVTLNPSKDNALLEPVAQDNFEDRSNGAGPSMCGGRTQESELRRPVFAFDIAGNVPAGSTIDSVQLTLVVNKAASSTGYVFKLHRLTQDWGEGTSNTGNSRQCRGEAPTTGEVTWSHTFYPSSFWTNPGAEGDYLTVDSATATVGSPESYSWGSTSNMVADVQFWLDNPSQNYGWILIGREDLDSTAKRFASRENTQNGGQDKPQLLINFTPQTTTGACCSPSDACTLETGQSACEALGMGYAYEGDGTTCSPNPCVEPFGACCADDGTCTEDTQSNCETAGDTFQGDGSTCSTVECPVVLTPYVDALPVPEPAIPISGTSGGTATYRIIMKEFTQQLHSELPATTVWGYDNDGDGTPVGTPGPVIEARENMPVTVQWVNDIRVGGTGLARDGTLAQHYLDVDVQQDASGNICIHGAEDKAKTVVHLHGGHVPADVDGYPESTFVPGEGPSSEVQYVYPNGQQAGYLWFHDHALGITRYNVYMGLAGLYLMRDSVEDALNIPNGEYEIPLVLQDRKFNPDGSLKYPSEWEDVWFGDKVMVNGKVWPYLEVKQGKYRFRLLNGSGSRVYTLSLNPPSGLLTFTVIGTEGGLLEAPVNGVGQLTIGPGERYDVVVDFSSYALDDEILLENSAAAPYPAGIVDLTEVMKFKVVNLPGDTDALPGTLRTIERLQEGDASITRDFRLKRSGTDGCGRSDWLINDLHWDDITEYPELGETEIWRFINDSGIAHPMHLHLVFFQILDRQDFTLDGSGNVVPTPGTKQPPLPEEDGWKDTAMVNPNEILRVIARFEDYKGRYAYHCHILEHEDHEMMRQFETVLCGDGIPDATEACDDGGKAAADGCSPGCDIEERVALTGTAAGDGTVGVSIDGTLVSVTPSAGETAAQVAASLAAAINADPNLSAAGITATAVGSTVVVDGDITAVVITDSGIGEELWLSLHGVRLWWSEVAGATGYDLVQGSISALVSGGGDYSAAGVTLGCLSEDSPATFVEYAAVPSAGDARWFLVRPQGTTSDTYDTGAASQSGLRDTEIGSSGNDCL